MKSVARIELLEDSELIKKCFAPEKMDLKQERAKSTIVVGKKKTEFFVEAQDAIALRAALASISKMLAVIEKMKDVR